MKNTRKPSVFIVGGPHSGTTSLYNYLTTHPQICMSKLKEPNYAKFTNWDPYIKTEEEYLAQWDQANGEKILAEATPTYIYSPKAARAIHEYNPDAKIIMILRDPNQALQSWFASVFIEQVGVNEPHFEIFNHEKNVPRFTKYFPPKQLLIINFADYIGDTRKVYQKIMRFLDIEDDGKKEFPNHKQGYTIKSNLVNKFILKYFHGQNKLKTIAKKFMSGQTAQKIADMNKVKKKNKKQSAFGSKGFDIGNFEKYSYK